MNTRFFRRAQPTRWLTEQMSQPVRNGSSTTPARPETPSCASKRAACPVLSLVQIGGNHKTAARVLGSLMIKSDIKGGWLTENRYERPAPISNWNQPTMMESDDKK